MNGTRNRHVTSREVRRIIIEESYRAGVGHIGSALSIVELLVALYGVDASGRSALGDRDKFILSKGHAALALYAVLFLRGWIDEVQLSSYCTDGTMLGVHPEHGLPGVHFSTGSLGHGLSFGTGAALAAQMQISDRRTFVLMSDAELNEGSVWEAAMFAAHHRLSNLVAFVDVNGQQALGRTKDVLSLAPLGDKWRAFNWDVHEVDGHDGRSLKNAVAGCEQGSAPHIVLAATTFGKGVSYMEGSVPWHYRPMTADLFAQAAEEIGLQE